MPLGEESLEYRSGPFAGLVSTGIQWPEARGFARQFAGNPYAQSRLLETLVGFYKLPFEGWGGSNVDYEPTLEEKEENKLAIAGTIKALASYFAEWREIGFELDSDFGLAPYNAQPLLIDQVDEILERHFPDADI
jgi:hypothetical protein